MKNKILIVLIIILIPFTLIKVKKEEKTDNIIYINLSIDSVVKKIELEEYVLGVVAAEMPALFHNEALKSQSIASRTYAYNKIYYDPEYIFKSNKNDQSYITKKEMKQKWENNFEEYYNRIKNCVNLTKNLIISYNDKPISAYYFSMTNGYTENSTTVFNETKPYLKSVDSLWDKDNKNYEVTTEIEKQEFCNKLNISCNVITIENIIRNDTNHIEKININKKSFTGIEIRKLLSLRSTDFEIAIKDSIEITTKGYGHGVGMSQYGANYLANQNKGYEDILKYYYQDTFIKKI